MVAAGIWEAVMRGDDLRFHVVARSGDQPTYFAAWKNGEAVWSEFDGRRLFWLLDEAESVIRHVGCGKVVIEQLPSR